MKGIVIFALVGGLVGSSVAYTQSVSPERKQPKYLNRLDKQFKAADKDGDGALTKVEAQAAGLDRIVENFERLDANGDGKLTREEIRAALRSRISS